MGKSMQKKLVRKAIAMIQKLAIDDEESYLDFYEILELILNLVFLKIDQIKIV